MFVAGLMGHSMEIVGLRRNVQSAFCMRFNQMKTSALGFCHPSGAMYGCIVSIMYSVLSKKSQRAYVYTCQPDENQWRTSL